MVKLRFGTLLRFTLGLMVLHGLGLTGCSQQTGKYLSGKRTPQISTVSKDQLMEELENFEDMTTELLRATSQALRELAPETRIRRNDIVRNIRFTQALQIMIDQGEPIVAFLETWGLILRLADYYTTGYGQDLFGEYQNVAVSAANRLVADIEQIARHVLSEQEFEETKREVRGFARRHPVNESLSNLIVYATESRPGEPSPFEDILSIPLAPITAMKGVDRTASAIYSVKESVKRTSDVIETLPESARWELLIMLHDMEEAEVVNSFLTSASTFSQSSSRLADIAERLPSEMSEQVAILIKEIDDRQTNLQQTIDKTKETAEAIDHGLVKTKATIEALERTANTVTTAAEQWNAAAAATGAVVTSIRQWRDSAPEKPTEQSTTIQDYQATILAVTEASNELQALILNANKLVESEALTARINDVQTSAGAVIDHISWRLIQLAGMIALFALGFRLASARILKRSLR